MFIFWKIMIWIQGFSKKIFFFCSCKFALMCYQHFVGETLWKCFDFLCTELVLLLSDEVFGDWLVWKECKWIGFGLEFSVSINFWIFGLWFDVVLKCKKSYLNEFSLFFEWEVVWLEMNGGWLRSLVIQSGFWEAEF